MARDVWIEFEPTYAVASRYRGKWNPSGQGGSMIHRRSIAALMVGICACAFTFPIHSQERASFDDGVLPDFDGVWGRTRFEFEPPYSGAGPVTETSQVMGVIAGDYNNPILQPWAADVIRHRVELAQTAPAPSKRA